MRKPNPEYIDALKLVVKNSPYPRHMAMELDRIGLESCDLVLDLAQCHLQPFGIVHGGVIATLIDTATFWAAFLRLPQDTGLVNVDLKLNYLGPVTRGKLRAKGLCLRPGRSISYSEAKVFDEKKTLIAHGTSTLMALPGKGLAMDIPKFIE
ncbi:PaaI family thioesterase [Desulfospira joergensenii]|uniref:PaaI family thioesterase n=1 Tax=Desulfospira joergensenii TaxID=53329 RepID=UPI0003B4C99E|nr:PaaI family thioesterase [Desulfospira joergensenii]